MTIAYCWNARPMPLPSSGEIFETCREHLVVERAARPQERVQDPLATGCTVGRTQRLAAFQDEIGSMSEVAGGTVVRPASNPSKECAKLNVYSKRRAGEIQRSPQSEQNSVAM